jgi:alpha-1,3-mannosyl-glycoprotein beta-1,2-N-acetylglucosaminyltransferase
VRHEDILVVQDGNDMAVVDLVALHGLRHISKPEPSSMPITNTGRLAHTFKYGINMAFDFFQNATGIIIVEDDLLFSPDFLEFFYKVYPVMQRNEKIYVASAWNDNGHEKVTRYRDVVKQTDFFPGLGWLCTRKLWNKLEPKWPKANWDWGVRNMKLGYVIHPEIPRDYHIGVKGTFMNKNLHNQLFKYVKYNQDPSFTWDGVSLDYHDDYDRFLINKMRNADFATPETKLSKIKNDLVIVYKLDNEKKQWTSIGRKLHIWHETGRAMYKKIIDIWVGDYKVLLVKYSSSLLTQNFHEVYPVLDYKSIIKVIT